MIGIAVLGAGYAGTTQLRGWGQIPAARVAGVYDPNPERRATAAQSFGVQTFDNLDALLNAPGIDAVDIATPVGTHREMVRRAAARGKAVLVQKPLSISYEDAQGLVQDCEDASVRLMVNENWRWRAWYRAARALVDEGALGRLTYLHLALRTPQAVATGSVPRERVMERQPFLRTMKPLILFELGPHHLDVARFLFGDPKTVFARTLKVADYVAGEEMVSLSFGYPDRIAQVELSWASMIEPDFYQPDTLTLEGTEGTLRLTTAGKLTLIRQSGEVVPIPLDRADFYQRSWTAALAHFVTSLEAGTPFETSGAQNLGTLKLLFEAYRSAQEGRQIDVG